MSAISFDHSLFIFLSSFFFFSPNLHRLISRLKSQPSSREGTVRVSVVRVGHKSDEDGNFEACFEHHRLPKWDKLADELNSNKGWSSETRYVQLTSKKTV